MTDRITNENYVPGIFLLQRRRIVSVHAQNVLLIGLSIVAFLLVILASVILSPLSSCSMEKPFPRCVLVQRVIAR